MQKIKLKIANWLYAKFPKRFCWADLVSWSYSSKLFPQFDRSREGVGCLNASKSETLCYCGSWCNGKHASEDGFKLPEELMQIEIEDSKPPF